MRKPASFTVYRTLLEYVARTRGRRSRSQRVNELLQRAIEQERAEALEAEAAVFFSGETKAERAETRFFHKLGAKSFARD